MREYTISVEDIELNGKSTLAFTTAITASSFAHIVEEHGMNAIDPDGWYPLEAVLDCIYDIGKEPGGMQNLVSIGMAAVKNAELPPEVLAMSPRQFFPLYAEIYQQRHRGGRLGELVIEHTGENSLSITMGQDVPYPDDVMYGIFFQYTRMLHDGLFTVAFADGVQRRTLGGEETVINISWE